VSDETGVGEIQLDDFARRFVLRAPSLMWFLGAGASASAGIPTARDMTWEFKQRLYVTQRGGAATSVADLSSPLVRSLLQSHIDSSGRLPSPDSPEEYAALFEAVWSAERDRQTYLDSKISGGKPSYGHLALATLMRAGQARLVWTTNFDPLIADACASVFGGTGRLTSATPDAPDVATNSLQAERWPIEVKLHGDFRSRLLKNTTDELRHQDAVLRQAFVRHAQRYGLVVVGYSGRDDSVMDAFEEVLESAAPFPAGVFWLHRGEEPPLPRVVRFLERARRLLARESGLVRVESFDEVMRDLVRAHDGLDTQVLDAFGLAKKWRTPAPSPRGRKGWPSVRLNALPIETPSVCRRVVCDVGGTREAREAATKAGVDVLVARRQAGVLAFGSDGDIRRAFQRHAISTFDLYTMETARLRHDSAERGLLREALTRAIARSRGLRFRHSRVVDFLLPADPKSASWTGLAKVVGSPVSGSVPNAKGLLWMEGLAIRLDWADERPWIVFEPRVLFDGKTDENAEAAAEFARERTVRRYNRQLNELLGFWAATLSGDGEPISALGTSDGVDAAFTIGRETAYSRRALA
jgi:SIR2-like domain